MGLPEAACQQEELAVQVTPSQLLRGVKVRSVTVVERHKDPAIVRALCYKRDNLLEEISADPVRMLVSGQIGSG